MVARTFARLIVLVFRVIFTAQRVKSGREFGVVHLLRSNMVLVQQIVVVTVGSNVAHRGEVAHQRGLDVPHKVVRKQTFLHATALVDEIRRLEVLHGVGVDERAVRQALEERRVHRGIKDEAGREAVAICTAARHYRDLPTRLGRQDIAVVNTGRQEDALLYIALGGGRLVLVDLGLINAVEPTITTSITDISTFKDTTINTERNRVP